MFNIDMLRQMPLFSSLTPDQLQGVLEQGEILHIQQGDIFVREGDKAGDFFVLLKGEVEFRTRQLGDREVHFINFEQGDFFGHELILVGSPLFLGSGYARCDCDLLKLGEPAFWAMISNCPAVIQKLLLTNAQRWQSYEALLQSQAKLISLGALAAGLAHELNNPAAAVLRSTEYLANVSAASSSLLLKLNQRSLTSEQLTFLDHIQHKLSTQIKAEPQFDPLTQSNLEEEVTTWLEQQDIPNGWKLAASFVAAGLDRQGLKQIANHFSPDMLAEVLTWLEAALNQSRLIVEVKQGTSRITQLVQAIKDYSYMDQASLQEIDIHAGLDNTVTILAPKLTPNIRLRREYAPNLPRIYACGSALNQVWTNLIDNAIDAMAGQGELTVRTAAQAGNHILVEIIDNGSGVPPDIQTRIFDPFFTTKVMGKGTGLGLDMARRIIVGQHQGDIQVVSQPGQTVFRVYLPIDQTQ